MEDGHENALYKSLWSPNFLFLRAFMAKFWLRNVDLS